MGCTIAPKEALTEQFQAMRLDRAGQPYVATIDGARVVVAVRMSFRGNDQRFHEDQDHSLTVAVTGDVAWRSADVRALPGTSVRPSPLHEVPVADLGVQSDVATAVQEALRRHATGMAAAANNPALADVRGGTLRVSANQPLASALPVEAPALRYAFARHLAATAARTTSALRERPGGCTAGTRGIPVGADRGAVGGRGR